MRRAASELAMSPTTNGFHGHRQDGNRAHRVQPVGDLLGDEALAACGAEDFSSDRNHERHVKRKSPEPQ